MRISAKEALEKAMIKISSESILDIIFTNIIHKASNGLTKYTIFDDNIFNCNFTNSMIDELFNNDIKRNRVVNQLEELGYNVSVFPDSILIKWEPTENK